MILQMATVAAMTEIVDKGVGRIVAKIDALGELKNTLIVYLSDNGASGLHCFLSNTPFRGQKGNLLEGGPVTHCIAHWPEALTTTQTVLADEARAMTWLLPAVVENVEEAVLNSLFQAETVVGRDGHTRVAVPVDQVAALVHSHQPS